MKTKGFTLIETLVAISILILAVTGAFSAAQSGISSAIFSKDQIVAFYLAQEGVEYVRNMRDQNGLDVDGTVGWLDGIAGEDDPCEAGAPCYIDAVNDEILRCPGTCPNIKLNENGFYTHQSGVDTKFKREVKVETVIPNQEVAITVTVTWSKGLVNREFVARENILNWQ